MKSGTNWSNIKYTMLNIFNSSCHECKDLNLDFVMSIIIKYNLKMYTLINNTKVPLKQGYTK